MRPHKPVDKRNCLRAPFGAHSGGARPRPGGGFLRLGMHAQNATPRASCGNRGLCLRAFPARWPYPDVLADPVQVPHCWRAYLLLGHAPTHGDACAFRRRTRCKRAGHQRAKHHRRRKHLSGGPISGRNFRHGPHRLERLWHHCPQLRFAGFRGGLVSHGGPQQRRQQPRHHARLPSLRLSPAS